MKWLLSATLVAMAVLSFVGGAAFADDDDDDNKYRSKGSRHRDDIRFVPAGPTIIACVNKKGHIRRLVNDASQCKKREFAVTWSVVGPRGATGPTGADSTVPGPQGPTGADGADGMDGEGGVKFVFVTSSTTPGDFGGLEEGNAICNARADAAALPGDYVAYLSDGSTNAIDRLPATGGPWFTTVGQLVAPSRLAITTADPSGKFLYSSITHDEFGGFLVAFPWTGTLSTGVSSGGHCDGWTADGENDLGTVGQAANLNFGWTNRFQTGCQFESPLYCFQID